QGARKQQQNGTDTAPLKVSDYMSRELITFKPEQMIEEVIQSLIKNKISGGPVVNDKNELVGMICEGDCLKQISESRYYNMTMEQRTDEKRMGSNVEAVDGNLNSFDAAKQFLGARRRRFPISEDGKLVGRISQKDILKAALELKGHTWK